MAGTSRSEKKINAHFTLKSTEYHLCNVNDVHHRYPQRSLLSLMESMGGAFKDPNNYGYPEGKVFRKHMILISPIEKFKTARIEITIIAIGKIEMIRIYLMITGTMMNFL